MKQIPLTQGKFALVDDEDFEELSKYKWAALKAWNTFYAVAHINNKSIKMHRLILRLTNPKILTDHRDRNGLNNQKGNLRLATTSQNNSNRNGFGASKYLGVSILKPNASNKKSYYRAALKLNKKIKHLGYFQFTESGEILAAKAYDKAAFEQHGEFANLNFK